MPIRHKLTAVIMLTSMLVLLLIGSFFVAVEIYSSRTSLEHEITSLANTLSASSKRLLLTNRFDKSANILASLSSQDNVRAAYLFDWDGAPVDEYLDRSYSQFLLQMIPLDFPNPDELFWTQLEQKQVNFNWQYFSLFMPIQHDGKQIGTIYLLSDLQHLYARLSLVLLVVLIAQAILLGCSWTLAGKLQRPVSDPILKLVEAMTTISQQSDYSVRVEKHGQDEIGLLVDGFNRMLEQIECHRHELVQHQESLEQTVAQRTDALRSAISVLEIAKRQAEVANEAKSQFLANITHELRTPLIGVLGMNELLFRTTLSEQQQMLTTTVQKSGEDLLALINDVLDFSKIEAGKMKLEVGEFYLYQTVEDVLESLAGQAVAKGLTLYTDISRAATGKVKTDEPRIRQILLNLLGNAIKFTERGSVRINLRCEPGLSGLDRYTIDVVDSGIGMDEKSQEQVFSAFYQADGTDTRRHQGTGLGLAIVQQLVELLGGSVSLDSSPGHGSSFQVVLNLPSVAPAKFELPDQLAQQPLLLHVDDEECRGILFDRLTEMGFSVRTSSSPADAWYQITTAVRTGKDFPLLILSGATTLPDGQPLYRAVREISSPHLSRRFLLLERTQSVALEKSEYKLYLPVGWTRLHTVLCQSWHELHLVEKESLEKGRAVADNHKKNSLSILLLSSGVADRELVKLLLLDLPINVDAVENFEQFALCLKQKSFATVIVDVATLPLMPLVDCCRKLPAETGLIVLHSNAENIAGFDSLTSALLEKPFKREKLLELLSSSAGVPVLTEMDKSSLSGVGS